jgi:hypothetical protein
MLTEIYIEALLPRDRGSTKQAFPAAIERDPQAF